MHRITQIIVTDESALSSLAGDLLTLSIIFFGLFHALAFAEKVHFYLSDLITHVLYSLFGEGLGIIVVRYLKKKEGLDIYDYATNFNPFKIHINKMKNRENQANVQR